MNIFSRRKRLEQALSVVPYNPSKIVLTREQKLVDEIIAKLRTQDNSIDDSVASDEDGIQPVAKPVAQKVMYRKDYLDILKNRPVDDLLQQHHEFIRRGQKDDEDTDTDTDIDKDEAEVEAEAEVEPEIEAQVEPEVEAEVDSEIVVQDDESLDADAFAMKTLQEIDDEDNSEWNSLVLSPDYFTKKVDAINEAVTDLQYTRRDFEMKFDMDGQVCRRVMRMKDELQQLLGNNIKSVNEVRMGYLQNWQYSKRKALELLTVEIEKLQNLEDDLLEAKDEHETKQKNAAAEEDFGGFCEGVVVDELNTSTPRSASSNGGSETAKDENRKQVSRRTGGVKKKVQLKNTNTNINTNINTKDADEFGKTDENGMVIIGPNGTKIAREKLTGINWSMAGPAITRKILCEVFDRQTLAFHTLTGKPSPAFKGCEKPSKQRLDPLKVADIVHIITSKLDMTPREVRNAITTKCADENKMYRRSHMKSGPRPSSTNGCANNNTANRRTRI